MGFHHTKGCDPPGCDVPVLSCLAPRQTGCFMFWGEERATDWCAGFVGSTKFTGLTSEGNSIHAATMFGAKRNMSDEPNQSCIFSVRTYSGSSTSKPILNMIALFRVADQSADNSPMEAKLTSNLTVECPSIVHPNNLPYLGFTSWVCEPPFTR